jgi:hypothetical protein
VRGSDDEFHNQGGWFMSSRVVALALAGLVLTEASAWAQRGRSGEMEAARKGWIFSLSAGQQQARKTGKPLMVVIRCVP